MKKKNFKEVSADTFAGLQVDLLQKVRNGQIPYEVFTRILNMPKDELVKRVLGDQKSQKNISFNVSDVFGHRVSGMVPQYFGDNYRNWIFTPNMDKVLTIPSDIKKLVAYTLPTSMSDSTIQSETDSTPMDTEIFLIVLYLLIINPELGKELLGYQLSKNKWYLLHTAGSRVRRVDLVWSGDEWICHTCEFDEGVSWRSGRVFLSFATV